MSNEPELIHTEASFSVFSHATAPGSPLYRRILTLFVGAKERFQVHLRPDDLMHELRIDGGTRVDETVVTNALDSLVGWGNLIASPDTGPQSFYRFDLNRV